MTVMQHLTDSEFAELVSFMQVNYGLALDGQRGFAEVRIQRLMNEYDFKVFSDFFTFVLNDFSGSSISNLVSALTVNYSLFYREAVHFDFLKSTVLPELENANTDTHDLRIWSAGCATGEEPYTIAMILFDYFGWKKPQWDTTILATDISTPVLAKAIKACYNQLSTQNLDESWLRHYFVPCQNSEQGVRVCDAIRKEVLFREHNLANYPYPFKRNFHFIFCRNVMIYFNAEGRKRLFQHFYNTLEDGGYLFVGLSETMERDPAAPFEYIMPSVYRKGGYTR